jgi:hypothetical protein
MTRLQIILLGGLVAVAAACSGARSTPQVASAAGALHGTATSAPAGATQLVHRAAQCVRDHGVPNFPDPVFDAHGRLQIDDQLLKTLPSAVVQSIQQACQTQINAAQAAANAQQPPATPAELEQATRFAQCMRQHGWPNFPDPDAHGGFDTSTPGAGPASKTDPSIQACRNQLPTRGN